jgi:hypothetical protein
MSEHPGNGTGGNAAWKESPLTSAETNVVVFDPDDDQLNPQSWPLNKKVYNTVLWGLTTAWITFASATYSSGTADISEEFHVSYNVATAGTSLLIFGFALGPMLWAPLCEVYGRKWTALLVCFSHFLTLILPGLRTYVR